MFPNSHPCMKKIIHSIKIQKAIIVGFVMLSVNFIYTGEMIVYNEPVRPKGQTDVLLLKYDLLPVVRVGYMGIGMSGRIQ